MYICACLGFPNTQKTHSLAHVDTSLENCQESCLCVVQNLGYPLCHCYIVSAPDLRTTQNLVTRSSNWYMCVQYGDKYLLCVCEKHTLTAFLTLICLVIQLSQDSRIPTFCFILCHLQTRGKWLPIESV